MTNLVVLTSIRYYQGNKKPFSLVLSLKNSSEGSKMVQQVHSGGHAFASGESNNASYVSSRS